MLTTTDQVRPFQPETKMVVGGIFVVILSFKKLTISGTAVKDKSTSTEGIRTTGPQFEHPSALPTELKGNCH